MCKYERNLLLETKTDKICYNVKIDTENRKL